ncbi:MAG: hypothetical protein HFE50_08375 [Clostridia bacterium]|nr:hypothetical protein [Clostridia bacterium]
MNNYAIGIIDEDDADIQYIERTILINKPENIKDSQVEFATYYLKECKEDFCSKIVLDAIEDIINEKIQLLIIDYKIMVNSDKLEGTEIFKKITEMVPKFPVVILSNLPQSCYEKEFVDADKVYSKKEFFKIDKEYSKQKTFNLFKNMDNYISQRAKISVQLSEQLEKLKGDDYSEVNLKELMKTEDMLDKFYPQQKSTAERLLDISDLRDAVNSLEKANKLLEG